MPAISQLVTFVAIALLGSNAGFFYTWSFTVMQALDLISAEHAISAMQSINANIRSAWFGVVFFGAPLASLPVSGRLIRSSGQRPITGARAPVPGHSS